jgi:hypothetical protein
MRGLVLPVAAMLCVLSFAAISLLATVELAVGAATCVTRAEYEMISCVEPPSVWAVPTWLGIATGAAVLLGILVARRPSQTAEST